MAGERPHVVQRPHDGLGARPVDRTLGCAFGFLPHGFRQRLLGALDKGSGGPLCILERSSLREEGANLPVGAVVGLVDTTQLALERTSIVAQSGASSARTCSPTRYPITSTPRGRWSGCGSVSSSFSCWRSGEIRTTFFTWLGLDPLPASTGIQARLCREDLLVEVPDANAILRFNKIYLRQRVTLSIL